MSAKPGYASLAAVGSTKTSGTTIALDHAEIRPGETFIVGVVADNLSASTPTVSSIGRGTGETNSWVKIGSVNSSTATAAGGVIGELWAITTTTYWYATTGMGGSEATKTITLSGSVACKAACGATFFGVSTTARGTVPSGTTNGAGVSTSGVPTATTSGTAPVTGDLVVGLVVAENNTTPTGVDVDTVGGSWIGSVGGSSTIGTATTGGGAAANVGVGMEYKIVTAGGNQTFNPTVNVAGDSGVCVVALIPKTLSAPIQPTILGATGEINRVKLTWTWKVDQETTNVYRDGVLIASGLTNGTITPDNPYYDTTGTPGVTYAYTVRGVNEAGLSTPSDPVNAASIVLQKIETLTHDFSNSTGLTLAGGATVSGGVATLPFGAGASAGSVYPTALGSTQYTIKDSFVSVEVTINTGAGITVTTGAGLNVPLVGTNGGQDQRVYMQLGQFSGSPQLTAGYFKGSTTSNVAGFTNATYSAVNHRWWRIREGAGASASLGGVTLGTAGNFYWDTSPDGITWTNRGSLAHGMTDAQIMTKLTPWSTTPLYGIASTSVGSMTADNWNLPGFTARPAKSYLTPSVGTASTPDPGVLPVPCVFVFKITGPSSGYSNPIAAQMDSAVTEVDNGWRLHRYGNDTVVPGGFNVGISGTGSGSLFQANVDPNQAVTGSPEWLAMIVRASATDFYTELLTSTDGNTWTTVGTGLQTGANFTGWNSSQPVTIGLDNEGGTPDIWSNRIYMVELRSGTDPKSGTVQWRFDADDYVSGTTFSDGLGHTWTLTDAAAITKPGNTYTETNLPVAIASTVTLTTFVDRSELARSVAIASTFAVTDILRVPQNYNETNRSVVITSTVATTDQADFKETGGAAPVVAFSDDFNRADGAPGANWDMDSGAFSIVSNQLTRQSGGYDHARFTQSAGSSDMYAEADVYSGGDANGGTGSPFVCLQVRNYSTGYGQNCYMGYFNASVSKWSIGMMQSGSFVGISDGAAGSYPAQGDKVRLEAQGSSIRLYHNGVLKHSVNDTTHSAATQTYAGINTNYVFPLTKYDNFKTGPLAAGTAQFIFSDDWNTADASSWDWTKWPFQRPAGAIVGSKGQLAGGGSPNQYFTDCYVTDFELTCKLSWSSLVGSDFPEIVWRVYDGMGSGTSANYIMQIAGGSGKVDLYKPGYTSSLANFTDATLKSAGEWWFKVRAIGNNHKVKWWPTSGSEPGTWQLDGTDATPPNDVFGIPVVGGGVGLRQYGPTVITVDDFSVTDLGTPVQAPEGSMRSLGHGKFTLGTNPAFVSDTDLTWSAWCKIYGFASDYNIMSLFGGGSTYFISSVMADGSLRHLTDTGDVSFAGYSVPLNTWIFIAAVRSSSGTEFYRAVQGDTTLTKVSTTARGTIVNLPMRFGSGEYGSGQGTSAAFKVWKAALSQAELTSELNYYAPQRTANLLGGWSMKTGVSPWADGQVGNYSVSISFDSGALVSGERASFLLDAPAPPISGVGGLGIAISSTFTVTDSAPQKYNETGRSIAIVSTVTPTDRAGRKDLALATAIASTVTPTNLAHFRDTPASVPITSTLTLTDTFTSASINYNETGRSVAIASTVTSTDLIKRVETGRSVTVVSTVTPTDRASFKQLALPVTVVSTVASTEAVKRGETLRGVAIVSTTTTTDVLHYPETARSIAIVSGFTVTDLLTQPGHFDETNRSVSSLITLSLSTDRAAFKDPARSVAIVSVVATTVDQADFKETGRGVAITSTVATADAVHRSELNLSIAITATVTSPTDKQVFREAVFSTAIVATITSTDSAKRIETLRGLALVAATTATDKQAFKEPDRPLVIVATTTATNLAKFKDLTRSVTSIATVFVQDAQSGAPINYNETLRAVNITSTVAITNVAAFRSPQTISVVSTATLSGLLHQTEPLLVSAVSTLTTTDQAKFKDLARSVSVAATVTLTEGTSKQEALTISIASTFTATSRGDFNEVLGFAAATVFSVLSASHSTEQVRALAVIARVFVTDLQWFAGGTVLNLADALYLGDRTVDAIYAGTTKVWP